MTQKLLIHRGEETWAPSGIAFINGGPWAGKLLVAALRVQQLLAITFKERGTIVEKVESWFKNGYGRLRGGPRKRMISLLLNEKKTICI